MARSVMSTTFHFLGSNTSSALMHSVDAPVASTTGGM